MLANFSDQELVIGVGFLVLALMLIPLGIASLYLPLAGPVLAETYQARYTPRRPFLLDAREQELMRRLRVAFPAFVAFPHVALRSVVDVLPDGMSSVSKSSLLQRLEHVQLGFLVCGADMAPLLALELVDVEESELRTTTADLDKCAALKSAGIPFVTVRAASMPTPAQLATLLKERAQAVETA